MQVDNDLGHYTLECKLVTSVLFRGFRQESMSIVCLGSRAITNQALQTGPGVEATVHVHPSQHFTRPYFSPRFLVKGLAHEKLSTWDYVGCHTFWVVFSYTVRVLFGGGGGGVIMCTDCIGDQPVCSVKINFVYGEMYNRPALLSFG